MNTNEIIIGEARQELAKLPAASVDMVITSPPYWGLRDYGTDKAVWGGDPKCRHSWKAKSYRRRSNDNGAGAKQKTSAGSTGRDRPVEHSFCSKCGAWQGELGLEPDVPDFIEHLCMVFDEVDRVLKPTGTLWVNLGDTYGGSYSGPTGDSSTLNGGKKTQSMAKTKPRSSFPSKSLLQIPSRFAIAMTDRGWTLRNEIIWHKPNVMPASVKDRFTVDFEKLYFFTKSKRYYFEQQFEPHTDGSAERYLRGVSEDHKMSDGAPGQRQHSIHKPRPNVRGKYEGTDYGGDGTSFRGHSGYKKADGTVMIDPRGRNKRSVWSINPQPFKGAHFAVYPPDLVATPIKAGSPAGGVVLDPFLGSGTTGLIAEKLGRKWIGLEINPEYAEIAKKRLSQAGLGI